MMKKKLKIQNWLKESFPVTNFGVCVKLRLMLSQKDNYVDSETIIILLWHLIRSSHKLWVFIQVTGS